MIQFEHVRKRYENGYEALRDVSFSLEKGELAFLVGHSGAGKSTLLKIISLIERPSSGKIIFNNQNVTHLSPRDVPLLRRRIGMIFQSPMLLNDRTVFDNVALPLLVAGYHAHDIKKRVRAALDQVGLLHRELSWPLTLSGGEQQRVGIARAVVGKPEVILADEPTGNLDPELSLEVMRIFERFNQVGVTTLVATHDMELIRRFSYPQLVLHEGVMSAEQDEVIQVSA